MDILNLFRKRSKIYAIELDDIKLNREIFNLVLKAENHLNELSKVINNDDVSSKDAKLSELENSFLHIKSKVDSLRADIDRILSLEIKNKDYITIHDDGYLDDKGMRLRTMSEALEDMIDLINNRPSIQDLKRSLLNEIYARVNFLIDNLNVIIQDDRYLQGTYEKLESV